APSWRVRGEVPNSTRHGSAPWKFAAPGAAKSQPSAAQPGIMEVGRAGHGEIPHTPRHGPPPWKFAALGRAKSPLERRMNGMKADEPDDGTRPPLARWSLHAAARSEERRVGKEDSSGVWQHHERKKRLRRTT